MAVASTTVWEFRPTATAGSVNGGGFNSARGGTDYSQQDTAQYHFTDLASSNANAAAPVVSSASHTFTSADAGNIMQIVSAGSFTGGWYEIVSVSGGNATLDRAISASASVSGGSYYVGGALTFDAVSPMMGNLVAGNIIWVKAGSYSFGQTSTTTSGTIPLPILFKGYNTSRGDNPTGSSRPVISCGANLFTIASNVTMYNIIITGTGTTSIAMSGSSGVLINCKVINTSTTTGRAAAGISGGGCALTNCEFISYRGIGVTHTNAATSTFMIGCYIHDSDTGVNSTTTGKILMQYCIVESCVTAAVNATNATMVFLMNCTLYGSENKTGIGISVGATIVRFYNSIIYGFVTGVSNTSASSGRNSDYNCYFNNTSDVSNWTKGSHDLAVNPTFTNVAQVTGTTATTSGSILTQTGANFSNVVDNQDFVYIKSGTGVTVGQYMITGHTTTTLTLDIAPGNSVAGNVVFQVTTGRNFGVGANVREIGFPRTYPNTPTLNYIDLGAVQRTEGAVTIPVQDVTSGGFKRGHPAIKP